MTVRSRALVTGLGLALLAAGMLAGCATPRAGSGSEGPGSAPTGSQSTPPSGAAGGAVDDDVEAAWLDGGRTIGLVTRGSSSCAPNGEAGSYDAGVLEVTLADDPAAACTKDLAPRVTLVPVPPEVDPTQSLRLVVSGAGFEDDVELEGVAGLTAGGETDYLPSAGWTDDGQFVVLTWGSSSCAPMIESVAPTSATEVTVTFETSPADQVCTMDMAPRAVVAEVDDEALDDDGEVFAILTGAEFDDVRIPIVGQG